MDRARALEWFRRFHEAQGDFYAGGPADALRELLNDDVVWHVPGESVIAGIYEGVEAVMGYFARRRDFASGTFKMRPGEVLAGAGSHVAVLTDGTAIVQGRERRWSTVGLYRLRDERIAACWLLPLDPQEFDAAWGSVDPQPPS